MKLVLGKKSMVATMAERLSRFIMPVTESGCHVWIGATNINGYGMIGVNGRTRYVHRIAYELAKAPIPEGLQIDHLCRVRCCVNPDHLEAVTNKENGRRSESVSGKNMRKTHCPNGHPYAGDNLLVHGEKGYRRCRVCRDANLKRFKQSNPTYMRDYQREQRAHKEVH